MPTLAANRYAEWRRHHAPGAALQDASPTPPERLLQVIWQQQRLRRDALRTLDGKPLRVLHPGFPSLEGGPDFRAAVIQVDRDPPVTGDVEVDLKTNGWRSHGHDRNPAFQNVILHVVWTPDAEPPNRPTLNLAKYLDAPLLELSDQLETHSLRQLPEQLVGKCCAPLRDLDPSAQNALLIQAAHVRLHHKAAQFRARAQHSGWEQALWEGLFRVLGYKHNPFPMQYLAELRSQWQTSDATAAQLQSRLLGLSGLLPADLARKSPESDGYVRRSWDQWWRERDPFLVYLLPRQVWRLHGLRPANHPQRRLALAAHWAAAPNWIARFETWIQTELPATQLAPKLHQLLMPPPDEFWSWHWTLRSPRLPQPQPLLGSQRSTDVAINAVLPWLLARAEAGQNAAVRGEILRRYELWPAAEDNSVLRLARQRLLGRSWRGSSGLPTAASQQGLLQISRDFCAHVDATCTNCRFPELVRQWQRPLP